MFKLVLLLTEGWVEHYTLNQLLQPRAFYNIENRVEQQKLNQEAEELPPG